jgi:hypothetical protein
MGNNVFFCIVVIALIFYLGFLFWLEYKEHRENRKEKSILPIDLKTVDVPVLHRHLCENINQMYNCRNEDDKVLISKEKAINIVNELNRRWLLGE